MKLTKIELETIIEGLFILKEINEGSAEDIVVETLLKRFKKEYERQYVKNKYPVFQCRNFKKSI